jgi:predicted DNA-binding transcriptional regulator AlpA
MRNSTDDLLLKAADLKRRWGCSDQFLYQRLKSDPTMPRPVFLGTSPVRHWRLSDIVDYEGQRSGEAA